MSAEAFAAVEIDAQKHRRPSGFAVGQRVALRSTGEIGEVRAVDEGTCRVLVAHDGTMTWLSRLRVDQVSV